MTTKTVRFGLVGYGLFGKHHAQAIAACDGATLAAIAVKSISSRQLAGQAHPDAEILKDYAELLRLDDIDVVDVVVPNDMHYPIAVAALQAGKHLLLEKPMALKTSHCDELISLAAANDRMIAVNHELRLSPLWGGVRRLIDDGKIGRPQHVLIELSRFPYRQGAEGWRYDIGRVGSWILEEPIHFFDLARWYLAASGEPASIYARANSRHPDHPELRDNFTAILSHADGAYAVVSQTLAAFGHHVTGKIAGTEGTIWVHWSAGDARSDSCTFGLRYGLGDQVREVPFEKPTGELLELADQIAAVTRSVREGTPPPCTGNDGRWSAKLCLAAQRSVDTGQVVDCRDG